MFFMCPHGILPCLCGNPYHIHYLLLGGWIVLFLVEVDWIAVSGSSGSPVLEGPIPTLCLLCIVSHGSRQTIFLPHWCWAWLWAVLANGAPANTWAGALNVLSSLAWPLVLPGQWYVQDGRCANTTGICLSTCTLRQTTSLPPLEWTHEQEKQVF